MSQEKGDRVGAIKDASENVVRLYGFGYYDGDHVPEGSGLSIPNPRIVLDNGSVVWGYQCWWASEERIRDFIGSRKVEYVSTPPSRPAPTQE